MLSRFRPFLALLLCWFVLVPCPGQTPAPGQIFIAIVEGDEVVNNIRQRTAREPIVQVEDENHRPLAGAIVVFTTPNQGAGALFANGTRTLTVVTDQNGRAVASGLRPNHVSGRFQIDVKATSGTRTANASIAQTNVMGPLTIAGMSVKVFTIVALAAAGAAIAGAVLATRSGSGKTPSTITPGTPGIGPP